MHTGHQCKVNELEYGDLLEEACLVVNGETEIHRYSYVTRYIHIIHTHYTYTYMYIQRMCRCIGLFKNIWNDH